MSISHEVALLNYERKIILISIVVVNDPFDLNPIYYNEEQN